MSAAAGCRPAMRYVLVPAPVIGLGLWAGRSRGANTSKTISNGGAEVGIAVVLAQEVGLVPGDQHAADGDPPVLPARLGVLGLRVDAVAGLPHRGFERDAAVGIDR